MLSSGADPGFPVRGGVALKKNAPSGGRRENVWGISCEKSQFYAPDLQNYWVCFLIHACYKIVVLIYISYICIYVIIIFFIFILKTDERGE
jgi:hypothetical protein